MSKIQLIVILLCGVASQAHPATPGSEYWERDAALAAAQSIALERAVRDIGDVVTLPAASTLERLQRLETRPDWPLPAREAALLRFTRSLADLPRDAVAVEVMRHLHAYQSRTLVPHHDHPETWVPLFNVRAAAIGVENSWQREAATSRAALTLLTDPPALVDLFAHASTDMQRHGYLDALRIAALPAVTMVQDETMRRLAIQPGLSPLLASTATITHDRDAMRELLAHGKGAGLAATFENFARVLGTDELGNMLEFAILEAPTPNASLAIATWWPELRHDDVARETMLGLLADAELGSSAALALSRQPDVPTIEALKHAASGDTRAARQARRALELNRASLHTGELR